MKHPVRLQLGFLFAVVIAAAVRAQGGEEPLILPKVSVYSEQVANQVPAATFAMPVSGLAFEPQVDVQARNFAEAQSDVAIRGGIFENTGFKIGALAVFDPQTGHYLAELPVAPAMLSSPRILTGAANAAAGFNAGVGTVSYGWNPIATRGELALAAGEYHTNRATLYQGWMRPLADGKALGVDVEAAHSESDGSVPFGDHEFKRFSGRVQLRDASSQTDLFFGWQKKFFGWPNLYTPFGFNETEDLETELFALNHRAWTSATDYWELGAFYRRNDDDYEFNRAVPGASNPFQHVTHLRSLALSGRQSRGPYAVVYQAQVARDDLRSTALTFGRFHTRDYLKVSFIPEWAANTAAGQLTLQAGATYDDTNRDKGAISPLVSASLRLNSSWRIRAEYSESTQVPTYTALNSSATSGLFRGNPDLGRETSRNLESGIEWIGGAWHVQASVFRRWDDDLVDWTYRQGVTARSANAVDVATSGMEFVATWRSPRLDVVLGYTWLDKAADYGSATIDASFYALNFARHRWTAALVARVAAGWEVRLDNEYRVQEKNLLRVKGGDEALLSGVGLYYLPAAWRGLELSARIDNLWDSDFQEVPAVPAGRRQIVFGAAYHW